MADVPITCSLPYFGRMALSKSTAVVSLGGTHVHQTRLLSPCAFPRVRRMHVHALCSQVRSILLTSGTLAPLASWKAELQLGFPHTLENPHIVGPDQVGGGSAFRLIADQPRNFQMHPQYGSVDRRRASRSHRRAPQLLVPEPQRRSLQT